MKGLGAGNTERADSLNGCIEGSNCFTSCTFGLGEDVWRHGRPTLCACKPLDKCALFALRSARRRPSARETIPTVLLASRHHCSDRRTEHDCEFRSHRRRSARGDDRCDRSVRAVLVVGHSRHRRSRSTPKAQQALRRRGADRGSLVASVVSDCEPAERSAWPCETGPNV